MSCSLWAVQRSPLVDDPSMLCYAVIQTSHGEDFRGDNWTARRYREILVPCDAFTSNGLKQS